MPLLLLEGEAAVWEGMGGSPEGLSCVVKETQSASPRTFTAAAAGLEEMTMVDVLGSVAVAGREAAVAAGAAGTADMAGSDEAMAGPLYGLRSVT